MSTGILRRLSYLDSKGVKQRIGQDEIFSISEPIVVLGDPGSGKSVLTRTLGRREDAAYYRAGTFLRSAQIQLAAGQRIIIDGLDEIASTALGGGVNAVLEKLSAIGSPPFILSCREADWRGAADRIKIEDDYARKPRVLHLEPFDSADATLFLEGEFPSIDAAGALEHLTDRGLEDLYKNPLTLKLLGEVVRDEGELPDSRAQLFSRACVVMLKEDNPRHDDAPHARRRSESLLLAAGALCAVHLLCDRTGIVTQGATPDGWVRLADLDALPFVTAAEDALRTRLFQAEGEGRFTPIHRVIAEYLGAKWIADCFESGISERRIFSLFIQGEGVPTSLRGLHAWAAHFSEALAARCIAADPYAVLRYGDADLLGLDQARHLLTALATLSSQDPNFRSGDWVDHSAAGLMRVELRDDLLGIITTPRQHTQLTALLLSAMARTPMAALMYDDLHRLMLDPSRYYVERLRAAEALFRSNAVASPAASLQALLNIGDADSARLAAELLDDVVLGDISDQLLVEILLSHIGLSVRRRGGDNDDERSSVPYIRSNLTDGFDMGRVESFLDLFTAYAWPLMSPSSEMNDRIAIDLVRKLVVRRLREGGPVATARLWSWLSGASGSDGYNNDNRQHLTEIFGTNPELRTALIRHVMLEQPGNTIRAGAYTLQDAAPALWLTPTDIAVLLRDVGAAEMGELDRERWESLVRLSRGEDGLPELVASAASETAKDDPHLLQVLSEASVAETPPWKIEQAQREAKRARERQKIYQSHRDVHTERAAEVAAGHFRDLDVPADIYLGRQSEFSHIGTPEGRVIEFLGESLASAALDGFIATLHREDAPTAQAIADLHAEHRHWTVEEPMICGAAEMVRRGLPLEALPKEMLASVMMAWRRSTESNVVGGVDISPALEAALFTSDAEIEAHFRQSLEPQLATGPREHVQDLYWLTHRPEWSSLAGQLCAEWLIRYPSISERVMAELMDCALDKATPAELSALLEASRKTPAATYDALRLWLTADFEIDFAASRSSLECSASDDRDFFWILRSRIERQRHTLRQDLSIAQLEFVVTTFGATWPNVPRPSGTTMGDTNAWDATAIIERAIYALAGFPSAEATRTLLRLIQEDVAPTYVDTLKHALNLQRKARRDHEYVAPSIAQLTAVMAQGLPESVDDMRAYFADRLETFQERARGGNTDMWQAFWRTRKPQTENICRNRLVDYISGQLPPSVRFEPEMHMPGQKRADIAAIRNAIGLPVEIKGQWHPAMWTAPMDQLEALYTRDWHAQGRGAYVVLWFGPDVRMPPEPGGGAKPTTSEELREMLIERVPEERRAQIDVYVVDLSRPTSAKTQQG